jgi:hypothetical protein
MRASETTASSNIIQKLSDITCSTPRRQTARAGRVDHTQRRSRHAARSSNVRTCPPPLVHIHKHAHMMQSPALACACAAGEEHICTMREPTKANTRRIDKRMPQRARCARQYCRCNACCRCCCHLVSRRCCTPSSHPLTRSTALFVCHVRSTTHAVHPRTQSLMHCLLDLVWC